jgi:hypothetical protein
VKTELAIVAALEALESGDVDLCREILLGAREDGFSRRPRVCPSCAWASNSQGSLPIIVVAFTTRARRPRDALPPVPAPRALGLVSRLHRL